MMQVTVITPIAPHHEELFVRCADSVRKQTVLCRHLHMIDTEKKGPGYIRNLLLKQVKTPFVVFLDADDYLEPTFVEECLQASKPDKYVYTNWYQGGVEKETPDGAFWDTAWHLVTCLIHTSMMTLVGGFDETLAAMEDTDLFLKFDENAYCGIKIKKPLVHYTNDGKRSSDARAAGLIPGIKKTFTGRYVVGCCGGDPNIKPNIVPIGTKAPGDVLVMPLWSGNRNVVGQITRRRYGRAAKPRRLYMDKRDAIVRRDLYYIFPEPVEIEPKAKPKKAVRQRVKRPRTFADMLCAAGVLEIPPEAPLPVVATSLTPDYIKLNEIAQRIYHVQGKSKRRTNQNSGAIIARPSAVDPVLPASPTCGDKAGRQPVAIGNG